MKATNLSRPLKTPKLVVTTKSGRDVASAPAAAMAPLQFHIGKILVPVDFSGHSEEALRYALAFAAQFHAKVTLVHIVEQVVYRGDWMAAPLILNEFTTQKRAEIIKRLRSLDAASGVKTQHIVRLGRAWHEVVEIAREEKADLIVLATHGYTGLKHVLLGSVAEKIVQHAHCPVLTVRAHERDFR